MSLWDRLIKKLGIEAEVEASVAEAAQPDDEAVDEESKAAEEGSEEGGTKARKKTMLSRLESGVRRKVDRYVDGKADKLMGEALTRAEEFRTETLEEVQSQALQILDLAEQRIDEKLVDIEMMLEKRLRAELRMRLRALIWTLGFVLLMALVSFVYVWVKRQAELDGNTPDNAPVSTETNAGSGR